MSRTTGILILLQLTLFSASTIALAAESILTLSGRVVSSTIKFYEDGSGKPNKFEFSTTDGKKFVMYSKEVLLAPKASLIDIQLSPIQSSETLLVCSYEIKSTRIVSNGVESDLIYKEPQKFVTTLGEGCN